jgi:hypothetical protein
MTFESTSSDQKPLSNRAANGEMPALLSATVKPLLARRAAGAPEDLLWRYQVGKVAHQFRYDVSSELTEQALAKIARALNVSPNTLRAYARVAEAVAPSEFAKHVALRDRFGMPMTWSHLEEIAKCRSARARRKCAQQAISKKLSVRALATLVRAFVPDGGPIDIAGSETD